MPRLRSKLLLLGAAGGLGAYALRKRRAASATSRSAASDLADPTAADVAPDVIPTGADPRDPVQGIDEVHELHIEDLGVEAMSEADVEADVEIAQVEVFAEESAEQEAAMEGIVEGIGEGLAGEPPTLDTIEAGAHDTGELYGVHTPRAEDNTHPDNDAAFEEGQNWLEALETDAIEKGPAAEADLTDVVDDDEVYAPPHPSDVKDTPVADRGSGGRGGM